MVKVFCSFSCLRVFVVNIIFYLVFLGVLRDSVVTKFFYFYGFYSRKNFRRGAGSE